ncbi:MAG TPA: adenosylcobinamide-phosphate synthase CbiB [Hydrogenophaga sp.]|uniref:adenosylcobinamide-phosphate synthase CbiB n=1 Tax=Hydrogenophaga sp. TaxID=1904254 RepID=UPI002C608DC4|nr:adenosylcobinamide-phosphate synthase CbiB [Hydrogenophaga sp.]HSX92451.1 adenosylcobinamide-phosphate synthase CbiB [Hydrogenophaga sp.]
MLGAALSLIVALAVDRAFGEPRAPWHPVVWMGRALGAMGQRIAPARSQAEPRFDGTRWSLGVLGWSVGALVVVVLAWAAQAALSTLGPWWYALLVGFLLKPLMSWRLLREEVLAVEAALSQSLDQGRERLSWLVSRDTRALDASAVRESAIESLAENLSDSVVAPLFWFLVAGLPGAALYRWANTADAMWGYNGPRRDADGTARDWTWAGQWAARVDDVLSWVPARLTAALLLFAGGRLAPRALWREARRTPSPNAGWPMAALALALNLRLRKPGVYTLNAQGRAPEPADTTAALVLAGRALVVGLVLLAAVVLAVEGLP